LGSVYQRENERENEKEDVSLCEFLRRRPWLLLQPDDFNETRDLKERIGL